MTLKASDHDINHQAEPVKSASDVCWGEKSGIKRTKFNSTLFSRYKADSREEAFPLV